MSKLVEPKINASQQGQPAYRGLLDDMRAKVTRGEWRAGSMLPSRVALSRGYRVSLSTVQQAISQLIGEGVLYADGTRGTFVSQESASGTGSNSVGAVDYDVKTVDGGELDRRIPVSFRSARSGLTFGMIDCNAFAKKEGNRADAHGWIDVIATKLENAFEVSGGHSHWQMPTQAEPSLDLRTTIDSLLFHQNVDALVIINVFHGVAIDEALFAPIRAAGLPCVLISWCAVSLPIAHVFYDNELAGYQAAQHLLQQGYSHLAFTSVADGAWSDERLEGMTVLRPDEEISTKILPPTIWNDDALRPMHAGQWLKGLLESNEPGTVGIVAGNDRMAMQVIDMARELGFESGRDFGIVGFDGHPKSRGYALTTMRPPLEAMGEQAAQMLFNQLRGDETQVQVRLRSHLLPRSSTRRAPIGRLQDSSLIK